MRSTPFPALTAEQRSQATRSDVVRAAELLYAVDARDLAWTAMADLGDKSNDIPTLAVLAELTAKYKDARGMLLLGKLALARGYALDHAAFPNIGVPDYTPVGPPVEPAIVYSIVRQESWFNPKTVSSANALGLMQVTPSAGQLRRLEVQGPLRPEAPAHRHGLQRADGRGRARRRHQGLPRLLHHGVRRPTTPAAAGCANGSSGSAIRAIPRSIRSTGWSASRSPETRNYVQRVMENVQVYRVRFGGNSRLLIEADLRRGASAN